ncbi:camp-dependent protein kinase regulatory subunit [Neoconidiobolus thromboides FSU 785]|nr:camp-dependent protein kinase regulatory subunit [Neoconidiobolus thromboides FSU 785]
MGDSEKEIYESKHMLRKILEETLSIVLENRPEAPLQYIAECLQSLQAKAYEEELKNQNIKVFLKEVAEELQDQTTELQDKYSLTQPLRKKIRPDKDSENFNFSNGTNILSINQFQDSNTENMAPLISRTSLNIIPPSFNRTRRGSVSAESIQPSELNHSTAIIPKSLESKMRIASATNKNLLFRNLEDEQKQEIVDAMFEKLVISGEEVIKQGDEGDNFYVVDQGNFEIFVNDKKVVEVSQGGSFGELALMYNTPRAATVKAISDGVLWAVDRSTFRKIVTTNTFRKRRLYESFLRTVPLLSSLQLNEIAKISDALEPVNFCKDDIIIEQGSMGDYFYMIESGEIRVVKTNESGEQIELPNLKVGDYFGELALLNDSPRMATIIAHTDVKLVALSKDAFVRLLGPVVDILRRNEVNYNTNDLQNGSIKE